MCSTGCGLAAWKPTASNWSRIRLQVFGRFSTIWILSGGRWSLASGRFLASPSAISRMNRDVVPHRVLRLRTALSEDRPEVVLSHPFGVHLIVAFAARLAGVRRVVCHSGNPVARKGKPRHALHQVIAVATLALDCPVVFCSEATSAAYSELGVPAPRRSRVIHHGCDVQGIAERAQAARNRAVGSPRPVIGMVARLNSIKDQATLLRAAPAVLGRFPSASIWLVGDGEERPRLENLASQLGIADRVRFLGERDDVPELLGQMDVFCFSTTDQEGFGIALIEALSAGLPVVASDVPACREVLGDAARLVSPADPDAMSSALVEVLTQPALSHDMAQRSLARARKRFDLGVFTSQYYDALLGEAEVNARA